MFTCCSLSYPAAMKFNPSPLPLNYTYLAVPCRSAKTKKYHVSTGHCPTQPISLSHTVTEIVLDRNPNAPDGKHRRSHGSHESVLRRMAANGEKCPVVACDSLRRLQVLEKPERAHFLDGPGEETHYRSSLALSPLLVSACVSLCAVATAAQFKLFPFICRPMTAVFLWPFRLTKGVLSSPQISLPPPIQTFFSPSKDYELGYKPAFNNHNLRVDLASCGDRCDFGDISLGCWFECERINSRKRGDALNKI